MLVSALSSAVCFPPSAEVPQVAETQGAAVFERHADAGIGNPYLVMKFGEALTLEQKPR
jgi:hypothetical protein